MRSSPHTEFRRYAVVFLVASAVQPTLAVAAPALALEPAPIVYADLPSTASSTPSSFPLATLVGIKATVSTS